MSSGMGIDVDGTLVMRCTREEPHDPDEKPEHVRLDLAGLAQPDDLPELSCDPRGAIDHETDDDVALHPGAEPGNEFLLDVGDVPVVDLIDVETTLEE